MKRFLSHGTLLFFIALYAAPLLSSAAEPTYLWSKRLTGSDGGCTSDCLTPTIVGEKIYFGGFLTGNADFNEDGDSDDGGENGTAFGSAENIFFVRYDTDGNYEWSMRVGSTTDVSPIDAVVSPDETLYLAGFVDGFVDFNGDGDYVDGGESATFPYLGDPFVAAYDNTGSSTWATRLGDPSFFDYASAVSATNDLVLIGGTVTGPADLNGDGDLLDDAEGSTGYGGEDGFISIFSATGTHMWSHRIGTTSVFETVEGVAISDDKVFVTGRIDGAVDLNRDGDMVDDHESAVGYGGTDIFLSVFSTDGSYLWSKRLGSASSDNGNGIAFDDEYVYLVGLTGDDSDLSGDGDYLDAGESSTGYGSSNDGFISVFTLDGTYVWSKRIGGVNSDEIYDVAVDSDGVVYVTGAINGPADLTGDAATTTDAEIGSSFADNDIFVSSFDSNGEALYAMRLGGNNSEFSNALAVDDGLLVLTAFLEDDGDLSNDGDTDDSGESILTTGGGKDHVVTTFMFDLNAPTITSVGASGSDESPVITGNITDDRSTVAVVEYQLSTTTGSWSSCAADDSSFDESSESFSCSPTYPDEGIYTVYLRATDSPGNTTATSSISSIQVEVDYPSSGGGGGGCRSCNDDEDEEETDDESEDEDEEDDGTKVTVCHNETVTISIGAPAVPAHLDHADSLGACQDDSEDTTNEATPTDDEADSDSEDQLVESFADALNNLIANGEIDTEVAVEMYTTVTSLVSTLKELRKSVSGNNRTTFSTAFTKDLNPGEDDPDVLRLQRFLNRNGFTITATGPGSSGNETSYYGVLTRNAVASFQNQYANEVLVPVGLSEATGIFGPMTRAKINSQINQ